MAMWSEADAAFERCRKANWPPATLTLTIPSRYLGQYFQSLSTLGEVLAYSAATYGLTWESREEDDVTILSATGGQVAFLYWDRVRDIFRTASRRRSGPYDLGSNYREPMTLTTDAWPWQVPALLATLSERAVAATADINVSARPRWGRTRVEITVDGPLCTAAPFTAALEDALGVRAIPRYPGANRELTPQRTPRLRGGVAIADLVPVLASLRLEGIEINEPVPQVRDTTVDAPLAARPATVEPLAAVGEDRPPDDDAGRAPTRRVARRRSRPGSSAVTNEPPTEDADAVPVWDRLVALEPTADVAAYLRLARAAASAALEARDVAVTVRLIANFDAVIAAGPSADAAFTAALAQIRTALVELAGVVPSADVSDSLQTLFDSDRGPGTGDDPAAASPSDSAAALGVGAWYLRREWSTAAGGRGFVDVDRFVAMARALTEAARTNQASDCGLTGLGRALADALMLLRGRSVLEPDNAWWLEGIADEVSRCSAALAELGLPPSRVIE